MIILTISGLIETFDIDRKITLDLIQLFLRTPFCRISTGRYYGTIDDDFSNQLNKNVKGQTTTYNRSKLIEFQYSKVPNDTERLFNYFEKLFYDEKSTFIQACEAYIEGLKNENCKALMFFVVALETLSNTNSDQKAKNIYSFITDLYGEEIISLDFIEYIYNLRSLYSHQGLSNNGIKQNIFGVFDINKNLLSNVEMIAYSVLTRWLMQKGEEHGE